MTELAIKELLCPIFPPELCVIITQFMKCGCTCHGNDGFICTNEACTKKPPIFSCKLDDIGMYQFHFSALMEKTNTQPEICYVRIYSQRHDENNKTHRLSCNLNYLIPVAFINFRLLQYCEFKNAQYDFFAECQTCGSDGCFLIGDVECAYARLN